MGIFGQLMVCVAAALSAVGGTLALQGNHNPRALASGRRLLHAAAAAAVVALLALLFLMLSHDYRVDYVRDYADRTMTDGYLATAIWGGHAGSLLLWAALQALFTSAVAATSYSANRKLVPVALFFLAGVQVFFLLLVLFHSNPFAPLGTIAETGIGLNPLLRNPYMVIHPPTLFLGFVGFSVPMAFSLAALVENQAAENWLGEIRPFVIFAWALLGVGNVLGMVWAYEELGWGGYWAWDPVENASFMPWLTGTALMHSAVMQRSRKSFATWSHVLAWITFTLVIFGTFLTRSGVIASVHAFSGATSGPYLLGLIVLVALFFLSLLVWRFNSLATEKTVTQWYGREGIFYMVNVVLLLSASFVWLATMAPLFSELLRGEKAAVTPDFFNRWMVPFGLAILALIGLGLMPSGKKKSFSVWLKPAIIPVIIGTVIALVVAWVRSAGDLASAPWKAAVGTGLTVFVAIFVAIELRKVFLAKGASDTAKKSLRRRLGAHLVHLSVVLLFVGFTGTAYTQEEMANLAPGQSMRIGDYTLTFLTLRDDNSFTRLALMADLEVRKDGTSLGILSPSRHTYHSHPGRPTNEVDIRTSLFEDLFLILDNADPESNRAIIRAVVNPLVLWIWIGGALMLLGGAVTFTPPRFLDAVLGPRENRSKRFLGMGLAAGVILAGVIAGLVGGVVTATIAFMGVGLTGVVFLIGDGLYRLGEKEVSK